MSVELQTDYSIESKRRDGKKGIKMNTKMKIILRWLIGAVIGLLLITSGVYLWAMNATDHSLIARGIVWGDSDAGDLYRFPSRQIRGSSDPEMFWEMEGDIQGKLSGLPLDNPDIGAQAMPFNEYLTKTNTTAFIILHNDQLVYEGYFNGAKRESLLPAFSVTKSFFSTLVGIAIEEGYMGSLEDPITNYLPELLDRDSRFAEITIHHLLSMTSGLRWQRDEDNPFSDDFISYYSPNLRSAALDVEIAAEPGGNFQYNDYNPLLLGMALERAVGMDVSKYMESRLWQPMGAEGVSTWSLDSTASGFEKTFAGFNGRAIDLVKLGWLFLNEGKRDDTQIVPSYWVQTAANGGIPIRSDKSYSSYWWIDKERQMYFAEGDMCQFIYVYPQAELVLARFGTDCGGTGFSDFVPNVALWVESQLVGE